jgi:hypothetical protein
MQGVGNSPLPRGQLFAPMARDGEVCEEYIRMVPECVQYRYRKQNETHFVI